MHYKDDTSVVISKVLRKKLKLRAVNEDKTLKFLVNEILEKEVKKEN